MVLYYLLSRDLKKIEGREFTLRAQRNSQDSVRITDEAAVPKSLCRIEARIPGELITIDRRIDEIAQQQLSAIEVDGMEMRAQKLAELVVSGRDRHGWFEDEITLSPMHAPPLSSDEATRLREARRSLGADLVYVTSRVPSADSFPSVPAICDLHDVLVKRGSIEEEVHAGELAPLKANTPEVLEAARTLVGIIGEMMALTGELEEVGDSWPFELRKRCGHASFASERSALESLFEGLDALIEARAQFLKFPIVFPNEALQDTKTGGGGIAGSRNWQTIWVPLPWKRRREGTHRRGARSGQSSSDRTVDLAILEIMPIRAFSIS